MKTILMLLVGFIPSLLLGQQFDVPTEVVKTFEMKFQETEDVEWNIKDGNFEASFYVDDDYTVSLFNKNGVWLETATSINQDDISQSLIDKVYDTYKESEINNIFNVETASKNQFYRIELEDNTANYIINVSIKGVITEISKIQISNDEDSYEE